MIAIIEHKHGTVFITDFRPSILPASASDSKVDGESTSKLGLGLKLERETEGGRQ